MCNVKNRTLFEATAGNTNYATNIIVATAISYLVIKYVYHAFFISLMRCG